jgi:hypothetical protein
MSDLRAMNAPKHQPPGVLSGDYVAAFFQQYPKAL